MLNEVRDIAENAPEAHAPLARPIARGNGWSISEFICRLGPDDRPYEERYDGATIAAVVEGSFLHRSATGTALLHPGAFLLGNAGACYECGHQHGTGDRCIGIQFAPSLFEEIAASAAGAHRFAFPAAMLPGLPALALPLADAEAQARNGCPLAMDEFAMRLAEQVVSAVSGFRGRSAAPAARDERRISQALRYIEEHADEALDLDRVAAVACMSKYHFLRSFRRAVGVTPHQFLIGLRMRRAAVRLATTPAPVAAIAYEAGCGDLSTFNRRFRHLFGASPTAFRRARGRK